MNSYVVVNNLFVEATAKTWREILLKPEFHLDVFTEQPKLERIIALARSGLPTYDYYLIEDILPVLPVFFSKYPDGVVMRALPKCKSQQRKSFICENIADAVKNILLFDRNKYVFLFNEYDPGEYSGVIVAGESNTIIELVEKPNLDDLCQGRVTPYSAVFNDFSYSKNLMQYANVDNKKARQVMYAALRLVSDVKFDPSEEAIPSVFPRKGYYEFVYSKRDQRIRFVDYSPKQLI